MYTDECSVAKCIPWCHGAIYILIAVSGSNKLLLLHWTPEQKCGVRVKRREREKSICASVCVYC